MQEGFEAIPSLHAIIINPTAAAQNIEVRELVVFDKSFVIGYLVVSEYQENWMLDDTHRDPKRLNASKL